MAKRLKPMHPGEVLREELLVPLKMSAGALARACGLARTRIERIASEQTGITAGTALRLAKALGTSAQLGSICRTTMTFRLQGAISAKFLTASRR